MRIDKVRLVNYRCHRDIEVSFAPGFNVLAGVNGSGKTSLLRGVAETFHGFVGFLTGTPPPLHDDSIRVERIDFEGRVRFERQYPVTVHATGVVDSKPADWGNTRASGAHTVSPIGMPPGATWQQAGQPTNNAALSQTLPVLAFYRANRQWNQPQPHELAAATERNGRMDGYSNYADASTDSRALQAWSIAKCLERYQTSSETGRPFDDIDDDELALVNQALAEAIDEAKGIKYDMREKSLLVEWKQSAGAANASTAFQNLSDGQKAIVCLVADIARRICLLNPHLGDQVTRQTPGVVLIDELDMHLHPKWQRSLTRGLQAAFPSVQFIVASHSPQVLGEMQPDQIIVLTAGTTSHPHASYGLDSNAVLEEIMEASARPIEIENDLTRLFAAIERNELDTARQLLSDLRTAAPGVAELNRADALLKRKEVLGR